MYKIDRRTLTFSSGTHLIRFIEQVPSSFSVNGHHVITYIQCRRLHLSVKHCQLEYNYVATITDKNVSMYMYITVQKVEKANYSMQITIFKFLETFQNLITDLKIFACKAVQYMYMLRVQYRSEET